MQAVKKVVFMLHIIVAVFLLGCELPRYKNVEEYLRPIIVAQVPIAGYTGNSQLLETDVQGRELWKYETSRYLVYLICQKHDHEQVFYYEDFCFIIGNSGIGLSSTEINGLKDLNDWDQPLALEKASFRTLHWPSEARDYSWVTAKELIDCMVEKIEKSVVDIDPVDHDYHGQHLWLIQVASEEKPELEETEYYFAIITKDGEKESISKLLAVDDLFAYQTALHEFKLENSWFFQNTGK